MIAPKYGYLVAFALMLGVSYEAAAAGDEQQSATPIPVRDPRLHPNEVRVLDPKVEDLKEIVPKHLYMRHWFGTDVSIAVFRFLNAAGKDQVKPAFHNQGSEIAFQIKGAGYVEDSKGRRYPIREGDVYSIRRGVLHTGVFIGPEALLYTIVTPPRAEYAMEGEKSYFPGQGEQRPATIPPVEPNEEPTVRVLFNLHDVVGQLWEMIPGQLYHRHWHIQDASVSVTRMVRDAAGNHFTPKLHTHGEAVGFLVKGDLSMEIGGKHYDVHQGQFLVIPPYVPHTGSCVDDECLLVDFFTPSREKEWGDENHKPTLGYAEKK